MIKNHFAEYNSTQRFDIKICKLFDGLEFIRHTDVLNFDQLIVTLFDQLIMTLFDQLIWQTEF